MIGVEELAPPRVEQPESPPETMEDHHVSLQLHLENTDVATQTVQALEGPTVSPTSLRVASLESSSEMELTEDRQIEGGVLQELQVELDACNSRSPVCIYIPTLSKLGNVLIWPSGSNSMFPA